MKKLTRQKQRVILVILVILDFQLDSIYRISQKMNIMNITSITYNYIFLLKEIENKYNKIGFHYNTYT